VSCFSLSWFSHQQRRLMLAVASILLALHWAVPAFASLPLSGGAVSEPGCSSAQFATHQGALPRLPTPTSSVETSVTEPERGDWPTAEDAAAFRPASPSAAATPRSARVATPDGWHAAGGTASFEARGPPHRTS
jgi:hypothetical protein